MTLTQRLREYIAAAFTGLWIQSYEHEDALAEIGQLCRENDWTMATWDIDRGLQVAGQTAEDTPDPVAAVRAAGALARPEGSAVLVLSNFHRFLGSAEVVQALAHQVHQGKSNRVFLVIVSPIVQLPAELEKLFVVIEHDLPGREQLEAIASEIATEDGEMPDGVDRQRLLDAAAGLTRLEAENAYSLSLVRHGRLCPQSIWELKTQVLKKSGLLTLHRGGECFDDLGGLDALKAFCRQALRTRQAGAAVRPRGILLLGVPGTRLHFGRGCVARAGALAAALGRRALLVTSPRAMDRLGYAGRVTADLRRSGLAVARFRDLHAGPTTDDVDRAAEIARGARTDVVVALGGGAAIDCAKAVAVVAPGRQRAADLLHGAPMPSRALPIIAIPTTAGSGSEMSRAAVLTDPHRGDRRGLRGRMLFPRHAVVDPALTLSAEPDLTARTGFDALTHAIESYVSPKARSATDELALRAMRIVSEFLPAALNDPTDIAFREQLAWAATTMGVNLATVGTCLPHRLDKALCALRPELSHGRSLATLYPHWLRQSWRGNPKRFATVAEILQPESVSLCVGDRAAQVANALERFLRRVGLAADAAELGVRQNEIPLLAGLVTGDLQANPVAIRREDLPGIFRAILRP